jgi:hypothetical protein
LRTLLGFGGIILLLSIFAVSLTLLAEVPSWTLVSPGVSYRAVLYDGDLDGVPELLAVDGYVYTNLTAGLATGTLPYKVDLDGSGTLCLALYRSPDGYLTVTCPYGYRTYSVPANAVLRVFRYGVAVRNSTHAVALVGARLYPLPLDGVPLLVGGRPVALGARGGYLVLHYLDTGLEERLAPLAVDVAAASYDGGVVFGVGVSGNVSVFFRYDTAAGSLTFRPLPTGRLVQAVATSSRVYVLDAGGVLYSVDRDGRVVTVAEGVSALHYPADSVDSFTAVAVGRVVKVGGVGVVAEYPAPPGRVVATDWWGDVVAASTDSGIYVATTRPVYASVGAPRVVYAGEPVEVVVRGNYDTAVVRVGGRVVTARGNATVREVLAPGRVVVEVRACRGVFCVGNSTSILVLRRPLRLRVAYPPTVAPYGPVELLVEAFDVLRNASVAVNCTVRGPGGRVLANTTSGTRVTVPAVPDVDSSVLTVACGGGLYEVAEATVRSRLSEPYLGVGVRYYGSGLLEVYGYDRYTGEPWGGGVVVEYLGMRVSGSGRVLVTLPPGEVVLRVSLVRGNVTYYVEELRVVYYEDIYKVPVGERVLVADRVRVDVYTRTETLTRPIPVYHEVRVVDPLLLAATAAFTAGLMYALLLLLGRLPRLSRAREGPS